MTTKANTRRRRILVHMYAARRLTAFFTVSWRDFISLDWYMKISQPPRSTMLSTSTGQYQKKISVILLSFLFGLLFYPAVFWFSAIVGGSVFCLVECKKGMF